MCRPILTGVSPRPSNCAQRLSASKIGSHIIRYSADNKIWCSTPVGVKDRFTSERNHVNSTHIMCSTPVGVKDRFTSMASGWLGVASLCSTPVGVKDRFTSRWDRQAPSPGRAQRLSASKIGSRTRASSPFRHAEVLNACRRQRSVHRHVGVYLARGD